MDMNTPSIIRRQRAAVEEFGSEPLLTLPNGTTVDLANGYIPLLARFTFEDKAARGLRKRKIDEKLEPPIFFSATELVRDNGILLLTGPSGSGKTTFAKHLSFRLTTTAFRNARPLVRNDFGDSREENWDFGEVLPYFFSVDSPKCLQTLVDGTIADIIKTVSIQGTGLLVALDTIERGGEAAPELLTQLLSLFRGHDNYRLLLLGDSNICNRWPLPSDIVRHDLLPLLEFQRRQAVSEHLGSEPSEVTISIGAAARNPAIFALALQAEHSGHCAEHLLDTWLSITFPEPAAAETLAESAYNRIRENHLSRAPNDFLSSMATANPALSCDVILQLLAARHLASLPSHFATELFRLQPQAAHLAVKSCLVRLSSTGQPDDLVVGLLGGLPTEAQRGALIVADFVAEAGELRDQIISSLLDTVTQGTLSSTEREKAGRVLSRLGDPRDLAALAEVPAGNFIMGSSSHPNSQPTGNITLNSFRIGLYPVVVADYMTFVRETGRDWVSPDSSDPERLNAPATDVTWHDAREYCSWLTFRWRTSGKIGSREQVRLPTEPEWERAARGDQSGADSDGVTYPWGAVWEDEAANSEETGFNTTCAVGLFPKGRSPYGCFDMAGHVWEWCSTLWGEEMTTPFFQYPWRDDGRERPDAPEQIRRVLRGGCFSSPKLKANCTYRGSLEPSGFWRGNGFRIVVGPVSQ